MQHGRRLAGSVVAMAGLAGLLAGCPFEFEKDAGTNQSPYTFFTTTSYWNFAEDRFDTSFANNVSFGVLGTDLDSDVVAYQWQLVQTDSMYFYNGAAGGSVLRSIFPPSNATDVRWSERVSENTLTIPRLADGYYEMRARSVDDQGFESPVARERFIVFFDDIPPWVRISSPCGSIAPLTSWSFLVAADDSSRSGPTPRQKVRYRYRLVEHTVGSGCAPAATHSWSDLAPFTPSSDPVNEPIEIPEADSRYNYVGLSGQTCGWDFEFEVRDAADNKTTVRCCIAAQAQFGCE